MLDGGKPLRFFEDVDAEVLRGFAFLSGKPQLILVNADDTRSQDEVRSMVEEIRGRLKEHPRVAVDWLFGDAEAEIARLEPDDAREFLADLGLEAAAKNRIVKASFDLLKLIVFFTIGKDEVRAWPVEEESTAPVAAGTVHTDMQRGFIRAEVIAYDDFKALGSIAEGKKAGKLRLEGKEYRVRDGDIIQFLFNV
jgi:ribosome-binding ATPase YchF (GTP1/OBG family)